VEKTTKAIAGWAAGAAALVGAGLIVATAMQSPAPTGPSAFTVTGTFRLEMFGYQKDAGPECGGTGEFAGIANGTRVRVTDEFDTTTLATSGGGLDAPRWVNQGCEWPFTVHDVPAGHHVYAVVVGDRMPEAVSEDNVRLPITITDGRVR